MTEYRAIAPDGPKPLLVKHTTTLHPIVRIPGSHWIVVGGYVEYGREVALDVHLDADDPNHEFLGPEEWEPLPGAKKLARAYNLPFTKSHRLRLRRMKDLSADFATILDGHVKSECLLRLARMIRKNPDDQAVATFADWSPSGNVWYYGEKIYSNVSPTSQAAA